MDLNANLFIYSLLFSCIGLGFYIHGKRNNIYFLIFGLVLMVFPYFVGSVKALLVVGCVCILLPFLLNWFLPLD